MKDLFELFAAKRVLKAIGAYLGFSWSSFLKYWYASIPLFVLFILLFYFFDVFQLTGTTSKWWVWFVIYLICSFPFFLISYRKQTKFVISEIGITIGITEPIIVENKEYMTINYDTHKIAGAVQEGLLQILRSKLPFRKFLVNISIIKKPKLFYLLESFTTLRRKYILEIYRQRFFAILFITIDSENKKISFDVSYNDRIANADDMFHHFKLAFSTSYDPLNAERYVAEVCKIFAGLHGQAVIEFLIEQKDYILAHQVIDDSESILRSSFTTLLKTDKERINENLIALQKNILCNLEIYRCSLYVHQNEFNGSIKHIFKAIEINPFYPFVTYEQYKEAFNKKYAASLSTKYADLSNNPEIQEMMGNANSVDKQQMDRKIDELWQRVEYPDLPSFEDYIKGIMQVANSKEVNDEIERKLKTQFCESPVCEIIRGEVFKFIPKGSEKHQAMFIDRMPEVLSEFKKVLRIDPEFLLMYSRIGVLSLIYALEIEDRKPAAAEELMEQAKEMMKTGREIFYRLGMSSAMHSG